MEALVRDPRVASRNPHIFTNYDGVIADLLAQAQTNAGETRDLREKYREHSERINALERKLASGNMSGAAPAPSAQMSGDSNGRSQNTELALRITHIENRLTDLEENVRQQEFSSYNGQLLWKISDYARKRNDAVTGQQVFSDSPCFYTSRYGYKMYARLYLNGDGMGRGTHISVFFGIMCGHYDALLRWPFRSQVNFVLLDQNNVEDVHEYFRPDPTSSSFQRPRRETNTRTGCLMFCSLAELNNHAYVRDDTMFLKIIVDTTDL
ncbi:hypothetical protein OS493_019849 [Desmophyllum pertusum]|uniref:MATH domain-containing protein n=1 Tax=Desmophyllum pertusum TaxID=174260 RepID=A0A9W9YZP5_9CNID|nr:hypothetical protein OS493_019849 [Desmophyllum pertusum]